ncbi:hypothetical protein FPQ18DRAFT_410111 [Pyronema domesticum]|nr:hypothetical protein FPQ18DRAFT_410111 [Pyronema domesticum]
MVKVLEVQKQLLGEEHPDTVSSMNNLAINFHAQGRYREAEDLQMKVMETRKRIIGEEHPTTLISIQNLAFTLQDQGRINEAGDLLIRTLEICRKVHAGNHSDIVHYTVNIAYTLATIDNRAISLYDEGRCDEAESFRAKASEIRKRLLDEESSTDDASMDNPTITSEESMELQETVVKLLEKVTGKEHEATLASMFYPSKTIYNEGRGRDAITTMEQVISIEMRLYGDEHSNTQDSIKVLEIFKQHVDR